MKTVAVYFHEQYPDYELCEAPDEQPGRYIRDTGRGYITRTFISLTDDEFEAWKKLRDELERLERLIEQKLQKLKESMPVDQRSQNK